MVQSVNSFGKKFDKIKLKAERFFKSTFIDDRTPGEVFGKGKVPLEEEISAFTQVHSFANLLPYEAYDPKTGIYLNSDSLGFMLIGNPTPSLSSTSISQLDNIFTQRYPADTVIQVTMFDDARIEPMLHRYFKLGTSGNSKLKQSFFAFLAKSRVDFLNSGKWKSVNDTESILIRDYKIIISVTVPVKEVEKEENLTQAMEEELVRIRGTLQGSMKSCGIDTIVLEPKLFNQIMREILNPTSEEHDPAGWDEFVPLKTQMIDSETILHVENAAATISHKGERFSVLPFQEKRLPTHWDGRRNGELIGSFTRELLRLPCRFVATLTVIVPEQQAAETEIGFNTLRAKQMSTSQIGKYMPAWADRQKDWSYVEERVKSGDKLLQAVYRIMVITPEGTEREAESQVKAIHAANGWTISRSRYTPIQSILGILPMGVTQRDLSHLKGLGVFKSRLASTCTHLAPWIGEWKGTSTPVMMLVGRKGQLVNFNPFDGERNYNIAVAAASGSGKSFFTCDWLLRVLSVGGQAFVIDAGKSYTNLCTILGGTYIDFADKGIKINPFSAILDPADLDKLANEQTKMTPAEYKQDYFKSWIPMLTDIHAQMASPSEPLKTEEYSILAKAIGYTISQKGNEGSVDYVVACLVEIGKKGGPQAQSITERLTIMLDPYTSTGMYGTFFDGPSNIDLSNDLVVLELDALLAMGNLATVVLFILITQINKTVILSPDKSRIKACIIDEAWRLLEKGSVATFIEEAYRVFRKHNGSFMTIVQAVADYDKSQASRAAFDNSDWKIFLSQDESALLRALDKKLITNDDGKIDLMRTLRTKPGQYSELIICNGQLGNAIVRFIADPFTKKLFSTKASEAQEVRNGVASGQKIEDVINGLIARDNKHKMAS